MTLGAKKWNGAAAVVTRTRRLGFAVLAHETPSGNSRLQRSVQITFLRAEAPKLPEIPGVLKAAWVTVCTVSARLHRSASVFLRVCDFYCGCFRDWGVFVSLRRKSMGKVWQCSALREISKRDPRFPWGAPVERYVIRTTWSLAVIHPFSLLCVYNEVTFWTVTMLTVYRSSCGCLMCSECVV